MAEEVVDRGSVPALAKFREIRAIHDARTVRVYQAYNKEIAESAAAANSFHAPYKAGLWSETRQTWVKPSALWMAYRCGWGVKKDKNQARVLALDMSREGFERLLMGARVHGRDDCKNQAVIVQWDPERIMNPQAPEKEVLTSPQRLVRSIQVGIRAKAEVHPLLDPELVLKITDVTPAFVQACEALEAGRVDEAADALWPSRAEEEMCIPPELREVLQMDISPSEEVKLGQVPGRHDNRSRKAPSGVVPSTSPQAENLESEAAEEKH